MAVGGYKSVSFSWQGGRTDTPVERTKFVLNGICDAIIGANVGWQLDTLTPTSSDFVQMRSYDHTDYPNLLKVLKLVDGEHTYRLGIGNAWNYQCFVYDTPMKASDCCNTGGNDYNNTSANGYFDGGLYFGLIKDGNFTSDNTYGLIWNGQGLFTKWTPFSAYQCANSSCLYDNQYNYTYYFILKGAQIGLFFRSSYWSTYSRLKGFITGEIFKQTGHTSDENTIGTICLYNSGESESSDPAEAYINTTVGQFSIPDTDTSNNKKILSCVISADGTSYAGGYLQDVGGYPGSTVYLPYLGFDQKVVDNYVSSTTTNPGGRWTPCYMEIRAQSQVTYNVVPGDGFKGYIDTDLLRGVNPNYGYGQQLDGGNFVYLGGGFAIGWDPNNTVLLF